jgi:hypothetical protein
MLEIEKTGDNSAKEKQTVKVRVLYAPVKQPYKESHADSYSTLAQLKLEVLTHFGLQEGSSDGGSKSFQLTFDDVVQSNLSLTIGSFATDSKDVEFMLIEQFVQG